MASRLSVAVLGDTPAAADPGEAIAPPATTEPATPVGASPIGADDAIEAANANAGGLASQPLPMTGVSVNDQVAVAVALVAAGLLMALWLRSAHGGSVG